KALQIKKNYAPTYYNLGIALHELNKFDEAIANYDQAIQLDHHYIQAFNGLACALKELKRFEDAIAYFDRAVTLNPSYAEAYNNMGLVRHELKEYNAAIDNYEKAISIKPDYFEAFYNKGIAQIGLKQFDAAISNFKQSLNLKSDFAKAHNGLGHANQELKQFATAIANYEEAIHLDPNFADACWNKSLLKILLGEYLEGWALYERRWEGSKFKKEFRNFKQPVWLGQSSIHNKTILIRAEQGLGDSIQFCRYISMIEFLTPKQIILEVPKALISLLSTLNSKMMLLEKGQPIPKFDVHCPMMSLPHAFKTTVDTIPAQTPYLYADKNKAMYWTKKLGVQKNIRIGIVWSGSRNHKNDHNRSLSLKQFAPIFQLPFDFHSLQKEIKAMDLETLNNLKQIKQHQDDLIDFSDTAALIENLDIVITVDTSVAHLAGAMGKKIFILLPFVPDYRWMLDRNDSPWYPTATLFRQPKLDDWESVIDQIKVILQGDLSSTNPHSLESGS
ncbi:MAG: tetratricopeptide repeat-containing glycosyltransferase family protein, partial [Methylococcales bacterium]